VIDPDLQLPVLDRRHWANGWRLLVPPRAWGPPSWALAIIDDVQVDAATAASSHRLLRLIVAGADGRRAIDPSTVAWRGVSPTQLTELAADLGVAAVVAIERGQIAALSRRLEPALRPHHDLVEQGLLALRALKNSDGLWTYPALLGLLPCPSYDSVQRTFDLLVPDDSALVAYVFEDDRQRIHSAGIARKRRGDIDQITSHRAVQAEISEAELARSWQTSYPRVLAATERRIARPSIGIFLERATLMRIVTGASDQLSRELSAKRVIIDPAPTWLLGLLGGATVAAVASRGARMLAAMLPAGARDRASGLAHLASNAMRDSGMHPFALLGFDPLELWSQLRAFYRP
jgi:hypothetical protein